MDGYGWILTFFVRGLGSWGHIIVRWKHWLS